MLPKIRRRDAGNRYGTYFERMIRFGKTAPHINQLEHLFGIWETVKRPTAYQLNISIRHGIIRGSRSGDSRASSTSLSRPSVWGRCRSLRPIRAVPLERAYGNYLGLYRLGKFVAGELKLDLTQLTCVVGIGLPGDKSKRVLRELSEALKPHMIEADERKRPESPRRSPMAEPGRLIVFEGPDGVGKSAIAEALTSAIGRRGVRCERLSFPGRDEGSLGRHIYELHHDPGRFGIPRLTPESLQLLHIAAHLDAISSRIVPTIHAGFWIVLDRYWWSTWVYETPAGGDRKTLDAMIEVERAAWKGIVPTPAFLVHRSEPYRPEGTLDRWREIASAYDELPRAEMRHYPVQILENDSPLDDALRRALQAIDGYRFRWQHL